MVLQNKHAFKWLSISTFTVIVELSAITETFMIFVPWYFPISIYVSTDYL